VENELRAAYEGREPRLVLRANEGVRVARGGNRPRDGCCALLPYLLVTFLVCGNLRASAAAGSQAEPVALSERIGLEIDRAERDAYRLFPDIKGFESARILRQKDGKYRVEFTRREGAKLVTGSRAIGADTFELTRDHVRLVDKCRDVWGQAAPETNAHVLYQMALREALESRYDLSIEALDELERAYPAAYDSLGAEEIRADASRLAAEPAGLFRPGSVIDRGGFTDLMIFAGYYGLWFGIATPIAIAGDDASAEAIAAGSILGPGLSLVLAIALTSGKSITKADADMISMGGWFGTWQGLGWASYGDLDGENSLQLGLAGGLAGIAFSSVFTSAVEPSEGYASLMSSSVWWGAWLGFVAAAAGDADDPLPASLIGSDVLFVGTALAAENTGMTEKRVRLINLGGVLGAFAGSGLCVLGHIEDSRAVAGVIGLTSLIGAGVAVAKTGDEPGLRSERVSSTRSAPRGRLTFAPAVSARAVDTGAGRKTVPCFGLVASF
jgi:hypothetical protein